MTKKKAATRKRRKAKLKGKKGTKLYFAYGSNLNLRQMGHRCPDAEPLFRLALKGWELNFRSVADVDRKRGASCEGAVFRITAKCERALDRYEGFRASAPNEGLYRKVYFVLRDKDTDEKAECMMYVMNRGGLWPPSEGYLRSIADGFADWGIRRDSLVAAVKRAIDDQQYEAYEEEEEGDDAA